MSSLILRDLRVVFSSVIITLAFSFSACSQDSSAQLAPSEAVNPGPLPATVASSLPDFSGLVREYGDAVVNVEVTQRARVSRGQGSIEPNDPMSEFFRRFGIPLPDDEFPGAPMPRRGAGSGFIVSPDGYILTNAHVVADADEVTVRLTDRREFDATVVGSDARTDVAVVKIDASDLATVRVGDPSKMVPGQWVLAIGSPFGLENSATAGIVSAISRAVGGGSYVPFIQTDVAVNPGNSGGPLFNLQGEVVGINSMIFSRTGGYMGLSFAIPIDIAMNVRDQLVETGHVVRGRIGVAIQDVDAEIARSFGLDRPRGALVSAVDDTGPAAKAGIRAGDVILDVNGQPIDRFGELSGVIAAMKPGSSARLQVWRQGREQTITVPIVQLEEEVVQARAESSGETGTLGLEVHPLTAEERQVSGADNGLVVDRVRGAAAEAGIRPGDIIVGVNGSAIDSVRELREEVEDSDAPVALLVKRGNAQLFVPVG